MPGHEFLDRRNLENLRLRQFLKFVSDATFSMREHPWMRSHNKERSGLSNINII